MSKDKAYCLAKYEEGRPSWIIVNKFFDVQGYMADTTDVTLEVDNPPLYLDGWSVVMHEELVQW